MKPVVVLTLCVALAGCALGERQPKYVSQWDMFYVNPSAAGYASYEEYLNGQYYAMGGGVPSDLSNQYGKCMTKAYLGLLTPAELARLNAAATRTGPPMAGPEKAAFERQFVARVSAAKAEQAIRAQCPETAAAVEQALNP